ncbi:unnamed protein product [Paramecium sonneborni]|uniref:Uncharacterized protein n=1 Tax=Paramecium sonneborni TaxID=65129 RepID=A0A8S1NPE6_9CILI|nr:unnamed protein product [Paramecium sonneborni]
MIKINASSQSIERRMLAAIYIQLESFKKLYLARFLMNSQLSQKIQNQQQNIQKFNHFQSHIKNNIKLCIQIFFKNFNDQFYIQFNLQKKPKTNIKKFSQSIWQRFI